MNQQTAFDYIVVGGGSSGCVVAARLAELGLGTVLLLESGEPVECNPETMTADGFKYAFANDSVMKDRMSVVQKSCSDRSLYAGSGTGMGGSGSVNGMVYTRGDKHDFEQWPQGWHWDDVAPAFAELEQRLRVRTRGATEFTEICIHSAEQLGFRKKNGLNDGDLCGHIGYNDMNYENDQRRSSYMSFIHDNKPELLSVRAHTIVHKLIFQNKNAVGVEIEQNGIRETVAVNAEVILCAGALETPKLLMLSGVGPKEQLGGFGIELVKDEKMIGQNLHDHPNVCMFYKGKKKIDFGHPQIYGFGRSNHQTDLPKAQADTCYTFMAAPITLKQSMYRMLPALVLPGKLFYNKLLRRVFRKIVDGLFFFSFVERFVDHVYGVVVILGKPESRGQLRLASTDVRDQALIDPAYYREPVDMETMLQGVKVAKKMATQQGFREWGNTPLVAANKSDSEDTIKKWISGATMTTFHYCGTCAMGEGDDAPVGLDLKLKGINNVRVADASVIPEVPVSAINAPSMMIGFRAAEFIAAELNSENNQRVVNQ
jgi:choline dehydrogenase